MTQHQRPAQPSTPIRGIGVLVLLAGVLLLIVGGVGRVLRAGSVGLDFEYFRVAVKLWTQGSNPYDAVVFSQHYANYDPSEPPFALHNPPTSLPLLVWIGLLPSRTSEIVLAVMNTLAALFWATGIAWLATRRISHPAWSWTALLAGVFLLLYGSHILITIGQFSHLAAAALLGAWLARDRGWWVTAGILLGLLSAKPQYAVFTTLWFLLDRDFRTLGSALITTAVLSVPAVMTLGLACWPEWIAALRAYDGISCNAIGSHLVAGIPSVVAYLGGPVLRPLSMLPLGVIAVVVAHRFANRETLLTRLSLVIGVQMLLVYSKSVEMWLAAPMLAVCWQGFAHRRRFWVIALPVLAGLSVTTSFMQRMGSVELSHIRTLLLLVCAIGVVLSMRAGRLQSLVPAEQFTPGGA